MEKDSLRNRIYNFLENPGSFAAWFVQAIIFILIILSVAIFAAEFFYQNIFNRYEQLFSAANIVILAAFTIEYLARFFTAPKKWHFVKKPMSIVDFLAVFPNYLDLLLPVFINTTELRVLRIARFLRFLRFMRVLRVLKTFRYASFLKRIFQYQNTILEAITPVLILFAAVKAVILILEKYNLWIDSPGLGELFAIIGFALGIILSQKIGATYDKFVEVENTIVRLSSNLHSLALILDGQKQGLVTAANKVWTQSFLILLRNPLSNNHDLLAANEQLYQAIARAEENLSESVVSLYRDTCNDAALCLSKKTRLTPKPYDTLLNQATILYLFLIAIFIPGLTGMISLLTATYILYGMYRLTQDLDSIFGGEYNLISVNVEELERLART